MNRADRLRVLVAITAALDAVTDADDPRLTDVFERLNDALEATLILWPELVRAEREGG